VRASWKAGLAAALALTASGGAVASGAVAAPVRPAVAAATPGRQARLALPAPTGRYPVGTVSLHLIDRARANPWGASPSYRELMVSIWYPARDTREYPVAPQMLPGAAAHFGSAGGAGTQLYSVRPGTVDWAATQTSGHQGAPVTRHREPLPVVLYSPGAGDPRTWETTLVQDLASRGYAVVTIDHPYDGSEVEFPGGRVVDGQLASLLQEAQRHGTLLALARKILAVRVADTRFVVDDLTALGAGRNPDAEHRPLPPGLAGALDLQRIGMFGVSAGGFTTAQAMYEDSRIRAGIDVDGATETPLIPGSSDLAPVFRHGLGQPLMFMGDPSTDHRSVGSWKLFWNHTRGWHLDLTLRGASGENSYKDAVPLIPEIASQLGLPRRFVTGNIGQIDPAEFFDRWLRGRDRPLLDRPSDRFPSIAFIR
jgi:hypothetical protein